MDALNVQTDRRLNRSDSMVVWEELNEKYPCLQPARQNRFEREDLRYDIGYCIAFRMKNIAKSSLRDIVNYEESNVVCANNPDLSKLLLSRQGFFATKAPQEWLHVLQLHAQSAVVEELRGFIWKLATWSKVYIFSYELPRAALQKVVGILAVLLEHSHVDTLQSKEVQETSCVLVSA
jgi:hypothetical protein